jgi:hypothetical protein
VQLDAVAVALAEVAAVRRCVSVLGVPHGVFGGVCDDRQTRAACDTRSSPTAADREAVDEGRSVDALRDHDAALSRMRQ